MRSRCVAALWCVLPLAMTWTGCSSRALQVSQASPAPVSQDSSYTARMLQLAERYEHQGNREGALRMYQQIAAANPDDMDARRRIVEISGRPADTVDVPSDEVALAGRTAERRPSADSQTAARSQTLAGSQAVGDTQTVADSTAVEQVDESLWIEATRDSPPTLQDSPHEFPTKTVSSTSAPREMPVDIDPEHGISETPQNGPELPAWVTSSPDHSKGSEATGVPQMVADDSSSWWTGNPSPASETIVQVVEERDADVSAGWTRSSITRLCPGADDELRRMISGLDHDDDDVRKNALMALSRNGADAWAATPAVEALLNDSDELIRAHAAWAAWRLGDNGRKSLPILVSLTKSDSEDVVQIAAFFIGSMGSDASSAEAALRAGRARSTGVTRLHLSEALIRIDPDDQESLNELTRALQDENSESRWLATVALSSTDSAHAYQVVPAVTKRLRDDDPTICAAAALTLGNLGPVAQSAVEELRLALAHDESDVRMAAEAALACIQR